MISSVSFVGVVFLVWGGLSLANQFPVLSSYVKRYDTLGLLPNWSFFAPNPGVSDYRLVFRTISIDSQVSEWFEATPQFSTSFRSVWNPVQHEQKAFSDIVSFLFTDIRRITDLIVIQATWPYLALLSYVLECECLQENDAYAIQFAIVTTQEKSNSRKIDIAFLSYSHRIKESK